MSVILEPSIDCEYAESGQRAMWRKLRARRDELTGVVAFRVAPLLLVLTAGETTRVVVGSVAVAVLDDQSLQLHVAIARLWVRSADDESFRPVEATAERSQEQHRVKSELARVLSSGSNSLTGFVGVDLGVQCTKAISEHSRNEAQQLRDFRYRVEEKLAGRDEWIESTAGHSQAVSSLIQLNVMCGRAGDQAREAIREGLCLHLDDSPAYHAYRKLRDPMILSELSPADHQTRPWIGIHDASIRQCEELQRQLQLESDSIRSLILATASISSARDVEEQAKTTIVATALTVGLGIPALVLTLYGVTGLLPLSSLSQLPALIPVIGTFGIGATLVVVKTKRHRSTSKWYCLENVGFIACLAMVVLALVLAPRL